MTIAPLISPDTDAGVGVQVLLVLALIAVVTWFVRRERALVTFTVGLGMVVLGLIGLRGLH